MCALKLPKYRRLEQHEVICAGDEYTAYNNDPIQCPPAHMSGSHGWVKTSSAGLLVAYANGKSGKYRRIVADWAKPTTTRREPRMSRIATIIQRAISGQLTNAMDAAREVERIYDNSQRAKRRKEGK